MEQRRVLLIIVAVAVVLAVTIGVGLWLFYPRDAGGEESIAGTDGGLEWEPQDYIRGDGSLPGIEEETPGGFTGDLTDPDDEGDFVVTYGVRDDEPTVPTDRLQVDEPRTGFTGTIDREQRVAGDDRTASDGSQVGPADEPAPAPEPARAASQPAPASSGEPPTGRTSAPPRSSEPRTEPGATGSTSAPALSDRAYWIQVISSPNRDTVEQARLRLDEYQVGSRILTKAIGGTTYYRLRLGPYPVRTEAEKFLDWVAGIDGFADALIFVDYTTAVLAASPR